jgi:hypothetical protein
MLGVKHGILVVKKGGGPMDLIHSALDQFRITGEVADVVLTDGADSAGRTLSQQEASAIGISLLNTAEEGLPDIDDKWEVTVFLKDVSNASGIHAQVKDAGQTHAYTCTRLPLLACIHTLTRTHSLFLSLSHTHTHTRVQT